MPMTPVRPKQSVSADLVAILMAIIRAQFCGEMADAEWGKHSHFVKRNVVLWPAGFITKKGFIITAERYEQIMRSVFLEIKGKMTNAPIRYWPGYLMKCVQEHWSHHWEEYYQEARSSQALAESGLVALGKLPQRSDGAVEAMAATASILIANRKRKRKAAVSQGSLPGF
jgi:hypothetical protein